jgi:2-amino-4-hydroxy-6-hydroxymethyldihydropteridine diphosphokinase
VAGNGDVGEPKLEPAVSDWSARDNRVGEQDEGTTAFALGRNDSTVNNSAITFMIRQPTTRGLVPTTIHRCGISLGSNVGDRLWCLRAAAEAIGLLADFSQPVLKSPVYETAPVGCEPGTPSFFNAVMEIGFFGEPRQLLERLREVEVALGRPWERAKNDPRTIDLDLLYADRLVVNDEVLELPHPRLAQRRFVLEPLSEIRPGLLLPGHEGSVSSLLAALPTDDPPLVMVTRDW